MTVASSLLSTIALVASTGLFVVLLGGLVMVAIRSTRRAKKMEQALDAEVPKMAEMVQRRLVRRNEKPDTKLNLIINESFSASQRQR